MSGGVGTITATASAASETIQVSISTQVSSDVERIQQDYGRSFAARPQVYVMATDGSYASAQTVILGIAPTFVTSPPVENRFESAGVYYQGKVAIDWARSNDTKPFTVGRHELTHLVIDEIAGDAFVPAWLNEGSARLDEFTIAGSDWLRTLNQYRALSMAVNSRLITMDELTSQGLWNSRQNPAADYQYAEAQQIVQLLRDEMGIAGEIEILRLLGAGYTFGEGYQAMPRRSPADFSSSVFARIRAFATAPGIAFVPDRLRERQRVPGGRSVRRVLEPARNVMAGYVHVHRLNQHRTDRHEERHEGAVKARIIAAHQQGRRAPLSRLARGERSGASRARAARPSCGHRR
jgi:hypothetical protein